MPSKFSDTLILGHGPRRVLCLHGLGSNNRVFEDSLPQSLWDRFCFICPDTPGHGNAAFLKEPYSTPILCDWLLKLQKQWNAPYFIGHSLGALLALLLQAQNPVFQAGIVLDFFPSARHPRALKTLAEHFRMHHESALKHFYGFSHHDRFGLLSRILADARHCDPRVFPEIFSSLAELAQTAEEPISLSLPLFVIHQPGHVIDPKDRVNRIFLNSTQVTMVETSTTGHFVMLTDVLAFQQILTDCLLSESFLL